MRYQGRIVRWNEARGFGFIVPEQGEGEPKGAELFAHISALQCDGLPPMAGERVSYLIGTGQDGKPRAEQVYFPNSAIEAAIWATWASECVRELRAYGTSLAVGHCSILSASQEMVMPHLPDAHGTLHQRSVPSLPA